MKRALSEARREQTVSYTIGHVVEEALKTSRHVATETALAAEDAPLSRSGLTSLPSGWTWMALGCSLWGLAPMPVRRAPS